MIFLEDTLFVQKERRSLKIHLYRFLVGAVEKCKISMPWFRNKYSDKWKFDDIRNSAISHQDFVHRSQYWPLHTKKFYIYNNEKKIKIKIYREYCFSECHII